MMLEIPMYKTTLDLFSLTGKVAVVTGTSRGNGKTFAEALLSAGAIVHCLQRTNEGAPKHENAHVHEIDVIDAKSLKRVIDEIGEGGPIHILVNNAGITIGAPSESYAVTDWDKTMATDLTAPFVLAQLIFPYMKDAGGSIVNITSINSEMGFPGNPAYVAAKGGLKQLSKALANDWGKYGIRVNNLGLGYYQTDMTKKSFNDPELKKQRDSRMLLGRWGEAQDLAGPIVFLASDASRYMTGQDLYIDGGWLAKGL